MRVARELIPEITETQWKKIVEYLEEQAPKSHVEPHAISSATMVKPVHARRLLFVLYHVGAAELFVDIYHCEDHPSDQRRFADGPFEPLPWKCPDCERTIVDPGELRYDEFMIVREHIEPE